MDTEMIERCHEAAYNCSSKLSTSDAMHIVTEVIKAMREPTEKMIVAQELLKAIYYPIRHLSFYFFPSSLQGFLSFMDGWTKNTKAFKVV